MEEAPIPFTALFPADSAAVAVALPGGWRLAGASRRGLGHEYDQRGREDDFAIRLAGNRVALVALADGVGSRRHSALGARAAVRGATMISEATLLALATAEGDDFAGRTRQLIYAAFSRALAAVNNEVIAWQAHDPEILAEDLEATLQVWVAAPRANGLLNVAGAQIGDGALFARNADTFGEPPSARWRTLLTQQVGEANNEVAPLNDATQTWWEDTFFSLPDLAVDCVMSMTDGTADDLRPPHPTPELPEPDPYLFIDEFGALALRHGHEPRPAPALLDFLSYRKRQSLDDRTVVLLFREGAQ